MNWYAYETSFEDAFQRERRKLRRGNELRKMYYQRRLALAVACVVVGFAAMLTFLYTVG